jgi:hypothetical protein
MTKSERESLIFDISSKVVGYLADLEYSDHARVLAIMRGVQSNIRRDVFYLLDDNPGTFGYEHNGNEWHCKLRHTRNDPVWGRRLFALLETNDVLTRKHTAFSSFSGLVNAKGGYRPTLRNDDPEVWALAEMYDEYQACQGDARRAYRGA